MATTPLGNWSLSIDAVRDSISNVSAFQIWVNPARDGTPVSAATAKTKVYVESVSAIPSGRVYPHVVLTRKGLSYKLRTGAFTQAHRVELLFEDINRETIKTPDEYYFLSNPVGQILEGLMDLAGVANTSGYISDPEIEWLEGPKFETEAVVAAEGRLMFCKFNLMWGTP